MELFVNVLRWLCRRFLRIRVNGLEKLNFDQPTIIVANHVSIMDGMILVSILPPDAVYVIDRTMAKQLWMFIWIRKMIKIDSFNPFNVREMIKTLHSGAPLVIFPEGLLTRTGTLSKVYPGTGFLSVKTGAKIQPIWIEGVQYSPLTFMKNKFPTTLFPQVTLTVGESYFAAKQPGMSRKVQKLQWSDELTIRLQELGVRARVKEEVNLFDEFVATAHRFGLSTHVVEDINRFANYKQLLVGSHAFASAFHRLFPNEQRVALLMPNVIPHIVSFFALCKLGKTPVILNLSNGGEEWLENCRTTNVRIVLTSKTFVEKAKLEDAIETLTASVQVIYLEDIRNGLTIREKISASFAARSKRTNSPKHGEVILFTSGTLAKPKGVVLGHDQLYANVQQANMIIDITKDDVIFNALPMFHSFGLTGGILFPMLFGVPFYLYPTPLHYRSIPDLIYNRFATVLFGTSTFLAGYAKHAHRYDFKLMRYVVAGAEKLQPEVRELWLRQFGLRIYEGFGATEMALGIAMNTPMFFEEGTVGRAIPLVETRLEPVDGIHEGGRLFIKGPNLMKGYLWPDRGFEAVNDWYDTGDVVKIDERGFITYLARLKRFAKIAGEMVSLTAVEELAASLITDQEVRLAAVAVADPIKGERIMLYSTIELDKDALLQRIQENHHPLFYLPSKIIKVDQIPLLGSGKTDYYHLQQLANETN